MRIVSVLLNLSCTSETVVVGRFLHPVASKVWVRGSPVFLSPPQPETTLIRVLQSDFHLAKSVVDLEALPISKVVLIFNKQLSV